MWYFLGGLVVGWLAGAVCVAKAMYEKTKLDQKIEDLWGF